VFLLVSGKIRYVKDKMSSEVSQLQKQVAAVQVGMKLCRLKTPQTTAASHDTLCAADYSLIVSTYLRDAAKPYKNKDDQNK